MWTEHIIDPKQPFYNNFWIWYLGLILPLFLIWDLIFSEVLKYFYTIECCGVLTLQ